MADASPGSAALALAIAAIVIGGSCGALIGYAVTDLQCDGGCSTGSALGALIGGVTGAGGVAVIAVLTLRAVGEWRAAQRRDADDR